MKKVVLVAMSVILACSMLFALAGCGNSDEKVIRNAMNEQLEAFKNPNSSQWQNDFKNELNELSNMGVDAQQLVAAWVEGFDYTVGDIKINGNNATVSITIKCKQLNPAVDSAVALLENDPALATMTEAQIIKKYGEALISELKKTSPTTTVITVPCVKSGNTWSEGPGAENEYYRALLG